jgi:hypothetical protein
MVDASAKVASENDIDVPATKRVEALRELRNLMRHGPMIPTTIEAILGPGFDAYFSSLETGQPASLDQSLGLKSWGGVSPARSAAISRRNRLLKRIWMQLPHLNGLSASAAARVMSIDAKRYEERCWSRDQHMLTAPGNEPSATWWRILQSGLPVPQAKRLTQILQMEIQDHV